MVVFLRVDGFDALPEDVLPPSLDEVDEAYCVEYALIPRVWQEKKTRPEQTRQRNEEGGGGADLALPQGSSPLPEAML